MKQHIYKIVLKGFQQEYHFLRWLKEQDTVKYIQELWGDTCTFVTFHTDDVTLEKINSLGIKPEYCRTITW